MKFIIFAVLLQRIQCTIDGSWPGPRLKYSKTGDNPCNPLYWYPRSIPEYCYISTTPAPKNKDLPPIPMPIPVPVPMPPPIGIPYPPIIMPHPGFPPGVPPLSPGFMPGPPGLSPGFPPMPPAGPPPPVLVPHPVVPLPISLPYGIPLAPTNPIAPVAGVPLPFPPPPAFPMGYPPNLHPYPLPYSPNYPYSSRTIGMVPGVPGLVSHDGGINIMPFSDVYSDMLQNHKQKMVRRKLQKLLEKYENRPWKIRDKIKTSGGDVENEDTMNDIF